jgi:hypothetical protein
VRKQPATRTARGQPLVEWVAAPGQRAGQVRLKTGRRRPAEANKCLSATRRASAVARIRLAALAGCSSMDLCTSAGRTRLAALAGGSSMDLCTSAGWTRLAALAGCSSMDLCTSAGRLPRPSTQVSGAPEGRTGGLARTNETRKIGRLSQLSAPRFLSREAEAAPARWLFCATRSAVGAWLKVCSGGVPCYVGARAAVKRTSQCKESEILGPGV